MELIDFDAYGGQKRPPMMRRCMAYADRKKKSVDFVADTRCEEKIFRKSDKFCYQHYRHEPIYFYNGRINPNFRDLHFDNNKIFLQNSRASSMDFFCNELLIKTMLRKIKSQCRKINISLEIDYNKIKGMNICHNFIFVVDMKTTVFWEEINNTNKRYIIVYNINKKDYSDICILHTFDNEDGQYLFLLIGFCKLILYKLAKKNDYKFTICQNNISSYFYKFKYNNKIVSLIPLVQIARVKMLSLRYSMSFSNLFFYNLLDPIYSQICSDKYLKFNFVNLRPIYYKTNEKYLIHKKLLNDITLEEIRVNFDMSYGFTLDGNNVSDLNHDFATYIKEKKTESNEEIYLHLPPRPFDVYVNDDDSPIETKSYFDSIMKVKAVQIRKLLSEFNETTPTDGTSSESNDEQINYETSL
jgi:hypothetical protein